VGIKTSLWERFSAFIAAATKILHTMLTNNTMVTEENEELREFFLCEECSGVAHISNMNPKSRMNYRSVR